MYIYYAILLLILILYILKNRTKKENFYVIKKQDNCRINTIKHKWTDDFSNRFEKHEPETNIKFKGILPTLPNNSYIIDVGSHVGDTGLYIASVLKNDYPSKNIKVIMIDPDKTKIDFIEKMAKVNNLNNVVTYNKGVSNKSDKGIIEKNHHPGGWTINTEKKGTVNLDRIDNICKNKNISMLHIDVEGMEYECLQGCENILNNVKYIIIELNDIKNRNNEKNFLLKHNFFEIPDNKIYKENGNTIFKKLN